MKIFYLYIIGLMIVIYFDDKYGLKSVFIFAFLVLVFLKLNNVKTFFNAHFWRIEKLTSVYIVIFLIGFVLTSKLLPVVLIDGYLIDKIDNYSIYGILLGIFVGPIMEELIFRGSFLPYLMKIVSPSKAVLHTSIGFVLAHFLTGAGILSLTGISFFFCYIYLKKGGVIMCILAHAFSNILGLAFDPFYSYLSKNANTTDYLLVMLLGIVCMFFAIFKIQKQNRNADVIKL